MSGKNVLPTNAYVWGLSMVAPNEAVMGALLGMAKLWGCSNIGYDAIPRKKRQSEKDPARVALGKKGGRPQGRKTAEPNRKTKTEVASVFLEPIKVGETFSMAEFRSVMAKNGWRHANAWYDTINDLIKTKVIKRVGSGKYRKLLRVIEGGAKKEAA